jgi:hypothetical protein
MAITQESIPDRFTPVNNPVVFSYLSTNVGQSGFTYVLDIYSANTSTRFARLTPPAIPIYNYGYANFSRILNSFVSSNFDPTYKKIIHPVESHVNYQVRAGEQYIYFFNFFDSQYAGSFFPSSPFSGQTILSSNTGQVHYFVTGDTVFVSQPSGPYDQNSYTVVAVPNSTSIIIGANFVGSAVLSGSAVYTDYRRTVFPNIYTSSTVYTASNAAYAPEDWLSYSYLQYDMNSTTPGKFFTDVYQVYKVRLDSYMGLNFFSTTSTSGATILRVETRDNSGNTQGVYNINRSGTGFFRMYQAMVGPYNLNLVLSGDVSIISGTLPIVKTDTKFYSAYTLSSASAITSEVRTFEIDSTCYKYDNIQLVFMDRKGSFIPFNFELASRKNVTVTRTNYKRSLGQIGSDGRYGYNSYDRGTTSINNTLDYEYIINSNWMTDAQSVFFEEIITSPEVYWYKNSTTWIAVTVSTNDLEVKRKVNGNLIQYEMKFKVANQPLVQIGG